MADAIQRWSNQVRMAHLALTARTTGRNKAIREAHAAGMSLRAIAEEAGLTHQRVAAIVKKEGE